MLTTEMKIYSPKERVPKEGERVLVSGYERESQEYPDYYIGYVDSDRWGDMKWWTVGGQVLIHVDWWMGLPDCSPLDVQRGCVTLEDNKD